MSFFAPCFNPLRGLGKKENHGDSRQSEKCTQGKGHLKAGQIGKPAHKNGDPRRTQEMDRHKQAVGSTPVLSTMVVQNRHVHWRKGKNAASKEQE